VDQAESEPDPALAATASALRVPAEKAALRNVLLVHYCTDPVFDGTKNGPWVETDQPSPSNVYGKTNLTGEEATQYVGGSI